MADIGESAVHHQLHAVRTTALIAMANQPHIAAVFGEGNADIGDPSPGGMVSPSPCGEGRGEGTGRRPPPPGLILFVLRFQRREPRRDKVFGLAPAVIIFPSDATFTAPGWAASSARESLPP